MFSHDIITSCADGKYHVYYVWTSVVISCTCMDQYVSCMDQYVRIMYGPVCSYHVWTSMVISCMDQYGHTMYGPVMYGSCMDQSCVDHHHDVWTSMVISCTCMDQSCMDHVWIMYMYGPVMYGSCMDQYGEYSPAPLLPFLFFPYPLPHPLFFSLSSLSLPPPSYSQFPFNTTL